MQDLVGVGVADAAQDGRIGQRALERVILLAQPRAKVRQVRVQHFKPAAIMIGELCSALLTTCSDARRFVPASVSVSVPFSNSSCSSGARMRAAMIALVPVQSTGDHQVNHQPQIVLEADRDALADAPQRR